jgi:hypothetical protein
MKDGVFDFLNHARNLGDGSRTLCGIRTAGALHDPTDAVLEDGHGPVQQSLEILRRMPEEPVRRILGESEDPEIQLQLGGGRRRPLYGSLPRRIRVEEHVDSVGVAAEHAQMTGSSRRPQGRNGVLDPRLVQHQDVGVALDYERRALLANGLRDLRNP